MSLKWLKCHASKSIDSDTRPRRTAGEGVDSEMAGFNAVCDALKMSNVTTFSIVGESAWMSTIRMQTCFQHKEFDRV
jgi:hypothetical protein